MKAIMETTVRIKVITEVEEGFDVSTVTTKTFEGLILESLEEEVNDDDNIECTFTNSQITFDEEI